MSPRDLAEDLVRPYRGLLVVCDWHFDQLAERIAAALAAGREEDAGIAERRRQPTLARAIRGREWGAPG